MTTETTIARRPGDPWQRPFWEAVERDQLVVQRCERGHHQLPGGPACGRCGAAVAWVPASGRGTVWSWAVFHQRYFRELEEAIPYSVLVVDLDEGARMICALHPDETGTPRIGGRVRLAVADFPLGRVPLARLEEAG
jgi:uncharacterized OB-fold protein